MKKKDLPNCLDCGKKLSRKDAKRCRRCSLKGNLNPMYGVRLKHSEKTKEKIRKAVTGEKNPFYGKTHTEETREKIGSGQRGEKHRCWDGGRMVDGYGYILIYSYNHPNKDKNNYVKEHRLVMEKHLGRLLKKTEIVHHINGDVQDNRVENLKLFSSNGAHVRFHREAEKINV